MPKIYYCKHCQQFLENEGYLFEQRITKQKDCPLCGYKYDIFEVENTNWLKVGKPFSIILAILFFIFIYMLSSYLEVSNISLILFLGILFFITILIPFFIYKLISFFDFETLKKRILKEHPEIKISKVLFKRKPFFLDPNGFLNNVTIYPNGIKAFFYQTINGRIQQKKGMIELVSKDNIINIFRYKFLQNQKFPTGFKLQTKDKRICIIKSGFKGKYYQSELKALKECFQENWNEIFNKRILNVIEIFKFH